MLFAPVTDPLNYLKQLPLRIVCLVLAAPIVAVGFLGCGVVVVLQMIFGKIGTAPQAVDRSLN